MINRLAALGLAAASLLTPTQSVRAQEKPAADAPAAITGVARIRQDAAALRPYFKTPLALRFLDATADLPTVPARRIYIDSAAKAYVSEEAAAKRSDADRAKLKPVDINETVYYGTKYGTPIAYARPLEVLAARTGTRGGDLSGKRVLDFGYGMIGHLRLLAQMGAEAVGVDVDPLLPAIYSAPGDTGPVGAGRVRIVDGRWPADEAARQAVGGGYDLILSKNTLKNGYLHPAQPVDKRMLVDLGVSDAAFVRTLYDALKPGGYVVIYNLSPAPSKPGKPYIPWSDGRCPFPREALAAAGFRLLAYDVNEDAMARTLARAMGWDRPPYKMDLDNDLFALYTILEKPKE
jgi:SAM-dependent methyltransferase